MAEFWGHEPDSQALNVSRRYSSGCGGKLKPTDARFPANRTTRRKPVGWGMNSLLRFLFAAFHFAPSLLAGALG